MFAISSQHFRKKVPWITYNCPDNKIAKGFLALIIRNCNVNTPERNSSDHGAGGKTGLMYAVKMGDLDVAAQFLAHGANANLVDLAGHSALTYAASQGDSDMIKLLIMHGADPGQRDKVGISI